jgi:hypothetical protein
MLVGQAAYAYIQQDHIAHIQDHVQFAMNPFLGQSPFADPGYLNNLIEHLKQHMTLWYLNRSNGYVQKSTGKLLKHYDDPTYTPDIDKLYTVVGAHVMMDTSEVMGQFMEAFQQLVQMAQAKKGEPVLPPDAQVVKDTSMAETQRKTAADQAKAQNDQAKLIAASQKTQADNQTKIAIKNAELTHQAIEQISGAQQQVMPAQPPQDIPAQPPEGDPNGNFG